jgi:gamma-glutamylputrescine oxidase
MTNLEHTDSYYASSAIPFPRLDRLEGEVSADVCVVGGGYTGVSTALNLAEAGYDVVLLEANRIGWGASGRNGGQICSGYSCDMGTIAKGLGKDDARKLFDQAEESKAIIRERVARHAIDCGLTWGYYHAADRPRELRELAVMAESWQRDYGYEALSLIEGREASQAQVASPRYIGGLLDSGGGHLHPLSYCLGLAAAARAAGARLFEGSAVTALEEGERPRLRTADGSVQARFVVFACNAYLGDLVPRIRKTIMPIGNYIGASEPMEEARARRLIPQNAAIVDCKFVVNYYRLSQDHRMLFGGRVSYSTVDPPNLAAAMRRTMLSVFPDLADLRMDYAWGGYVAITMDRAPHIGRLGGNVYFAQGFSGQGVALCGLAGKVLAEVIAGQAERYDLFARLPHRPFPGGKLLRTPSLALGMLWYRLRDLMP